MDRTLLGIVVAFSAALGLVGLTFSRSSEGRADFRFVNGTEPKTLDPQLITGQPEARIAQEIFEGLTRLDAKTLRPVQGVATSWDVSTDGLRFTFHLRPDARWTDGRTVTAADFVYAWKRLLDPTTAAEYAYILFPIRYAEALNTADGYADALSGPVMSALGQLKREHANGLSGREWQVFVSKNHLNEPLRNEHDPRLDELLSRRTRPVTAVDLEWLRGIVGAVAVRQRAAAADARVHFGKDGGVFAPDARTLVVELRAATPYFLQLTSFFSTLPVPSWVVEARGRRDDWFLPEHIVTNGPFRLSRWLLNDHIRLVRNDSYWGRAEVKLRSIDALATESDTTALNLYLTHEVDWLPSSYPLDLVDELRRRPDFYANPGLMVYFYRFNTTAPPFDDRRVREALNLAVDRKLIVEQVLGLGQIPAETFVPPGMPGYVAPDSDIRFDLARARKLLSDAGYPDGIGFPEVGILYNTSQSHKKVAEVIADQLRRNLGIRVNAYNQEWQSFLDTVRTRDYAIARGGWIGDYADPNTFLDMWVTNGGNNETGFSSPLYDSLIAAAADVGAFASAPDALLTRMKRPDDVRAALHDAGEATSGSQKRDALAHVRMLLFREAESILVQDEFPILPLYFYVASGLVSPKVRGFYSTLLFEDGKSAPNLQDLHPLRDVAIAGGAAGNP